MRILTCTLVAAAALPATASAAGWTTVDRSVAAMGAGGTGAARANDPAVAGYNPAAAIARKGLSATAGVVLASPRISAQGEALDAKTSGLSTPPLLYAQWADGDLGFGASLTVPFGSSVTWPEGWADRFRLQEARVQVLRTTAWGGLRLGPVRIAAGAFVDVASLRFSRSLDFVATEGEAAIDTSATGFGGVAGVYAELTERWSLGLSYASRSRLDFEGWADFTRPAELSNSAMDQRVTSQVTLPDRFVFGARFCPLPELELVADLELVLWNTVDALRVDFEAPEMADLDDPRDWRPTVAPRLGATYRALSMLEARAGFFVDPTPVPGRTVSPSAPDSTRVGVSVGAGVAPLSWLEVDLAYQLVAFTGQSSEADETRYGGVAHLVGFSAAVRID